MMLLFHGHERDNFAEIADDMYRLRARVFSERLGWDVKVESGVEIDEFDNLDPLYAVHLDEERRVTGTFRLLQTTGPTMLRDVFSRCLPPGMDVRSPIVWESTRFCVDSERAAQRGTNGLTEITGALLSSLIEIGVLAGLSHIVTVIDVRMERILRRAGCPIERLGLPVDYGGTMTLAILMECSDSAIAEIQEKNGLSQRQISISTFDRLAAA
jgi:N-acyl-L-homoserine lactone synthetase